MTVSEKIAEAISLMTEAAADMITDRDRLWADSDKAKLFGREWTTDNAAGNRCDAADTTLRGLAEHLRVHTEHLR